MKSESDTPKADGVGAAPANEVAGQNPEARRQKVPAWWLDVPQSEEAVIRDLVASIRGLKRSKSPLVAQAARKWERGIVCFIRFRLMAGGGASDNRSKGRTGPMGQMNAATAHPGAIEQSVRRTSSGLRPPLSPERRRNLLDGGGEGAREGGGMKFCKLAIGAPFISNGKRFTKQGMGAAVDERRWCYLFFGIMEVEPVGEPLLLPPEEAAKWKPN